jgi:hypothetical protein
LLVPLLAKVGLTPMISAPASINAIAMPFPIPLLQPVTMAVFPFKLNLSKIPVALATKI